MSTNKNLERICIIAFALCIIIAAVFMNGEILGITRAEKVMGYETKLFDNSYVHTIDIEMENWNSFIETAENEEYSVCNVTIDGETIKNVGIRGKGNTSLSNVSSMGSQRYSFKIEFDQYDGTSTYHGLDKLSLNNLIQDSTFMKDYLVYTMMNEFGANAPLC
ncbi:MAG: CotH kinase family protein, partial [Oscillospiraceae bacterium]|nr:CotH kinase family protein [Oscillospiraceae bacterium]